MQFGRFFLFAKFWFHKFNVINNKHQVRDCEEIKEFLLVGNSTELTEEEKLIQAAKEQVLENSSINFRELIDNIVGYLRTNEGIGMFSLVFFFFPKLPFLIFFILLARLQNFFPTLKEVSSITELPADYLATIKLVKNFMCYFMFYRYHCAESCEQVNFPFLFPFLNSLLMYEIANPNSLHRISKI